MNYTEHYRGIKVDVQHHHLEISDRTQQEIGNNIDKITRFTEKISAVDIYFKTEGSGNAELSIVGMRVGVPGPDIFAEEKGDNWIPLLKAVTEKVIRQLQKYK